MTEEQRQVFIPEEGGGEMIPITPQVNEAETEEDELSGLFKSVGEADTEDLTTVTEEDVFGEGGEDMSDLFEVPDSSIAPSPPAKKPKYKIAKKGRKAVSRPYPPPTTLGGLR